MLTWAPISNKTDIKITNPKLAISSLVNLVVWVKKPGPMAEVAIRNAAPRIAEFLLLPLSPPDGGEFLNSLIFFKFFIVICLPAFNLYPSSSHTYTATIPTV